MQRVEEEEEEEEVAGSESDRSERGSSCSWTPMLSGTVSRGRKPYCSPATVRLYAWWRWRKEEMEVAVGRVAEEKVGKEVGNPLRVPLSERETTSVVCAPPSVR